MAISDVISVTRSANTRTPTRQGFGVAALFAYHTLNSDVYRLYSSLSAMVTDGFTTASTAYKMAQAAFNQSPRPEKVMIVRAPVSSQSQALTVTSATTGDIVSVDVVSPNGTVTTCSHTVASETTTQVATALELLIEACSGVDSTASVAVVTITPTTGGQVFALKNLKNCTVAETTADPGYATNLASLLAVTTDFYFVNTEINSPLAIAAMRSACESAHKMYIWQTSNSVELTSGGTLFSSQKALSPDYGLGLFVSDTSEYAPCAAAAVAGTRDPGSYSLNLKELKEVTPVVLNDTQTGYLDGDNANYYVEVANGIQGILGTNGGGIASGGEYLDIVHGTDWFVARCQERVLQVQANQDKVDYTDQGVLLFVSALKAQCTQAERQRLFKDGTSVVTFDPTADADPTDKGNRYYPGLKIASTYAGAIHRSALELTLTV